ncbi:MAG TPA: ATP-binding cassette domain-containing protein [Thermoanaerobaculia bacterium]|nr:ATP-binding cassette domain-containing protein [Thermoanaerobaculia bacterium]
MLHLAHVTKAFGSTRAVDDVSLEIRRGEIVGLVGENGAGKTTLMRIAAGELAADSGTLASEGRAELVHQHFLLVNELTIAENLALARHAGFRFTTRAMLAREAEATIAATGIELRDVTRRVGELSVGERSKVELIKAIARNPSTLILDEPTSVLTPNEAEELFRVMRRLAAGGTAVIFISHKLPEVLAVAERIVVMRGGRVVMETRETNAEELARAMVPSGASGFQAAERERRAESPPLHLGDLTVHRGEIVAIVGVAGNGQAELAARLLDRFPEAGHIPEDRTRDGVIAEMTIAENLALKGIGDAQRILERYSIRARGPRQRAGDLSGGNQQKVLLARELERRPELIVAAEPTRGLDIEATRFVHDQLRAAADRGAAIVLITSDLDEAFALASALHVIYRGNLSERLPPEEASTRVAALMAGVA